MTQKLTEALQKQKKSTAKTKLRITGTLGLPIGGVRTVEVPNRRNFVYVKLRDNQNEVIQAFNNTVAPSYGLPVIVERQNNRYVVIGVDTLRYQNNWNSNAPFLPRHGNTHSFDPDSSGGGDVVWVHSRQFMPSLIIPSGSLGAPNVVMASYTLRNPDGTWKYVGNTGTTNITQYKPSMPTGAVMALVYLDSLSGNPYFIVGSGSYFPASITGTAQVTPYIPPLTNFNYIPLAAIRLVTGTSTIGWDNIYDLRQFLHNPTGTAGGGGGGGTGTIVIQDEGEPLGGNPFHTLNFVGDGISAVDFVAGVATIYVTGSNAPINLTGSSIGNPERIVGTTSAGKLWALYDIGWGGIGARDFIRFGIGVTGKETNAGKMGYEIFTPGFLDIVGAGTSAGERWTRLYDKAKTDYLQATNDIQHLGLLNSFVFSNTTGVFTTAINATEKTLPVITDYFLMLDSQNSNRGVRVTAENVFREILGAENNSTDIFRVNSASSSTFVGTIASKSSNTLVYNISSGNENALVPASTTQLAKLVLHNTTRGTSLLISDCNTGTNTLTFTSNVPAAWAVGDTITIASQTVSGGGIDWVDIQLISGVTNRAALFLNLLFRDTGTITSSTIARLHPFETFGAGKVFALPVQVSTFNVAAMALVRIVSNTIAIAWEASGSGTATFTIREAGYIEV